MSDRKTPNAAAPGPRISTIPATLPFADSLAQSLLDRTADDPSRLPLIRILLPTRRACRAVADAFLRLSGGRPLLLPRLQPIGDVDEEEFDFIASETPGLAQTADVPPAISELRRRLLLSRLVLARGASTGGPAMTMEQASWLAAELARLIDQAHTEGVTFSNLDAIVPEELSAHWQQSVEFLRIVTETWPAALADEGAIDPADRRNRLIRAQAAAWRQDPPEMPVIGAGSTGTIPATAELLQVIAGLPAGEVILPGLDLELDDDAWKEVGETPSHPQYGMHRLLGHMGIGRGDVRVWETPAALRHAVAPAVRLQLVSEMFRPSGSTEGWAVLADRGDAIAAALQAPHMLAVAECRGRREEAGAIAVALRQELELPGATAALVTPDRDLARQVAGILRRWGVEIDDSAGTPLQHTPPAAYLRLVAAMAAEEFAPVALLAALKHPLSAAGHGRAELLAAIRTLEMEVLRGPRPGSGLDGLRQAVEHQARARFRPALLDLVDRIAAAVAPLAALGGRRETTLAEAVTAHIRAAEALAATDREPGAQRLWRGDDGESAARFVDDLVQSGGDLGLPPGQYPDLFGALLSGLVVRPRYGTHPRLSILGPLEARLQHFGLVILGGVNEGTWPAAPSADPWMSRAMRSALGLLPVDRRTGLAAHDVAQALGSSRVLLTRAERVEGTPTVPSRWLLRLAAVLEGARLTGPGAPTGRIDWRADALAHHYEALDRVDDVHPVSRPQPAPPLDKRPRELPVTQIERWRRDPYAVYARYILGLSALEDLDASPAARDRGTFIHTAIDRFMKDCPTGPLPDDALQRLEAFGRDAFESALENPVVRAFWWPRFRKIAAWYVGEEAERRANGVETLTESRGEMDLPAPRGRFTLTAKADRLEIAPDGRLTVADYKTGRVPAAGEVARGYAPQLPLEALIALEGEFAGLNRAGFTGIGDLAYWRLAGGTPAGAVTSALPRKASLTDLIGDARDGLTRLVAAFDNPATPYVCRPRPYWAPVFDDYEHLARVREWSVTLGEDGG